MIQCVPGSDYFRSFVFMSISLGYIIYFYNSGLPSLSINISAMIIAITALAVFWSSIQCLLFKNSKYEEICSFKHLCMPKLINTVSANIFLLVTCFWVFTFGGIKISPFAPLLTFAPFYFIIQFTNDDEKVIFIKLAEDWKKEKGVEPNIEIFWKVIRILEILGLSIIIITVSIFEYIVRIYGSIFDDITINAAKSYLSYEVIGYTIFNISMLLAVFAVLPINWCKTVSYNILGKSLF